ncbi:MAG: tRNA (guanosine(46)-N7)-methyltransferase TrmB [Actinomycetales bacterium]|nr:tRNA (guanosine(46)-N7)-methyltransferase TrmB [Actinomycetales bacterium]
MFVPEPIPHVRKPRVHREVVSFTRRGGRLTERLQKGWDDLSATHVLDIPRSTTSTSLDPEFRLDLAKAFGREAPTIMEIGSGRGESIVHAALENPDKNFLALEVYVPGVAQGLVTMRHLGATNVRFAVVDAAAALATMLPEASLEELRVWFPDPWHKKKHNKRRLISPDFAPLAARVIQPGGYWRLATDWQEYADHMHEVLSEAAGFDYSGTWAPRFEGRPVTRFESNGLEVGRDIRDLSARRLSE